MYFSFPHIASLESERSLNISPPLLPAHVFAPPLRGLFHVLLCVLVAQAALVLASATRLAHFLLALPRFFALVFVLHMSAKVALLFVGSDLSRLFRRDCTDFFRRRNASFFVKVAPRDCSRFFRWGYAAFFWTK